MWLAVILSVILLCALAFFDTRKPKNFPPGPKWWPFFGSALQIARIQKRTGHLLFVTAEMSKKYGSVVGLRVGRQTIVVVHGTRAIKEFLASDDLSGRPLGEFYNLRTWRKRRGILLVDETFWQDQRRFFLKQLREFGFGTKNMSTLVEKEAQELIEYIFRSIHHNDSVMFDVRNLFTVHILNSLWKMLAGVRYSAENKKMRDLQDILNELFRSLSMVGTTFSHFPILKYLAPESSGYNLYLKAHSRFWEFLGKEIDYHKKTHNPDEPRDVMDVYLNVLQSPKKAADSFSEEQLLATCMDMFMAGSETTSNTLSFCFLYLILNPDVQIKAQEEIDRVIGKQRNPCMDDRPNMPYVECVVMESLRMFGGRAFTVPHRALKDTTLSGFSIPKKTWFNADFTFHARANPPLQVQAGPEIRFVITLLKIIVDGKEKVHIVPEDLYILMQIEHDVLVIGNLYESMLEEGGTFEEPSLFKPERFLRNGKISLPDDFLPFGMGKHRCLGESLARANIFLFIAALLQKFTFNIVPEQPPTTEWEDGITPGPKAFKARVKPRI